MSTIDISNGSPSSSVSSVVLAWPSTTRLRSNDVPPMSTHSRFGRLALSASAVPAIVPPTGPDNSVNTGFLRALSAVVTPPLDCMMWTGADMLMSCSCSCRLLR